MLLLPVRLDVLFPRLPIMNYGIIIVTTIVTFAAWFQGDWETAWHEVAWVDMLMLHSWSSPIGWFGSTLLHADVFHWLFNMVFLWVFGNAICAKVGNWRYLGLYVLFTLAASWFHLLIDDSSALGASGSINGIIGFYFALYPINQIRMMYWIFLRPATFQLTGYWVIGFWLLSDLYGALSGSGGVAYGAHLGGFIGGVALAFVLLKYKFIEFQRADNDHLFQRFFGRFNADELTKPMCAYCRSLGEKELRIKLGDLDEQKIAASLLARMMETKNAKSDDLIYSELTDEWKSLSRYFHQCLRDNDEQFILQNQQQDSSSTQMVSTKMHSVGVSITQTVKTLSVNIRSWGEQAFYVHRNGDNHGPYPAPLLADYYEQGYILSEDLVFDVQTQQWSPMQEMFARSR